MKDPLQEASRRKPLFWSKMLRWSIYFTIFGVGLSFIYARLLKTQLDNLKKVEAHSDAVAANSSNLDPLFIPGFMMVAGFVSILICLLMRSKEKKARN